MFSSMINKSSRLPWLVLLALASPLLLLASCGGDSGSSSTSVSSGTGNISFAISIQDQTSPASVSTLAISCEETNIDSLEGEVYDALGNLLQNGGPWNCLAGEGTIGGVPAGENRRAVVLARDSSGNVIYQGQRTGLLIEAGKTTEAGEIELQPTVSPPSLTLPNDDGNVTLSSLILQWSAVSEATQYRVVISTNADLTSPTINSSTEATTYTPEGLVEGTTYYWQVFASDSDGAESPGSDSRTFHTNYTNNLGMVFARVPAGTFQMGSPVSELGREDDETQHQVTLSNTYYIQTTEVTQEPFGTGEGNPSSNSGCPTCPVENLDISSDFNQVQWFIENLNQDGDLGLLGTYRLPTEAEWENANRAGSSTAFPNGEITNTDYSDPLLDQIGWYGGDAIETTQPVAQKSPNAYGLYDMQGNVWELVSDLYYYYPTSPVTDPTGPINPGELWRGVVRGGSYLSTASECRSANRQDGDFSWEAAFPLAGNPEVGFRMVFVPGNSPPSAEITSPDPSTVFAMGDTVTFTGTATDPEDGELSGTHLIWMSSWYGYLGTGSSVTHTLTYWGETIFLIAVDSTLTRATAQIVPLVD